MDQEDDDEELVQYQEALHNLEQQRDAVSITFAVASAAAAFLAAMACIDCECCCCSVFDLAAAAAAANTLTQCYAFIQGKP